MTTIAYKDGVVACDKQGTYYNQACKSSIKAIKSVDGETQYIMTGDIAEGLRFIQWLEEGDETKKKPKLKATVVYVFSLKDGSMSTYFTPHIAVPVEDRIWADGSGGQFAMGAMLFGASAAEAVKIATKLDVYTGGGVQEFVSERANKRRKKNNANQ